MQRGWEREVSSGDGKALTDHQIQSPMRRGKDISMKRTLGSLKVLAVVALALVLATGVALAHGLPKLTLDSNKVAPGGQITLSGDALGEDGQTVTLSLQGNGINIKLGTAKLSDDTFDDASFTIPANVPAGTYKVVAVNGQITASVALTVTGTGAAAAPQAAADPASLPKAGEPLGAVLLLAALLGGTGVAGGWLLRRRS
jgi:hypothetical protein